MTLTMRGLNTINPKGLNEMVNPTVASNRERIVRVEEDVSSLEERVNYLERSHLELVTKLDMLLKLGRAILAVAGATLGLEVGIEGGLV